MEDFEKLGAFYLGKEYDLKTKALKDDLVLYDSKDLNTHAVIIGMTGSGKTGLGIGLIEEAAIDKIPVIAIDPKGDLGNLLLTFPSLNAKEFEPWVNAREAKNEEKTVAEFAKDQAAMWSNGLAEWGQSGERIQKMRDTVEMNIYTPGSSSGTPISVLQSFTRPPAQVKEDKDIYREKIAATATSILALMGIDANPITSREHILISNILEKRWDDGKNLDLAGLINAIQQPPMERIGVMDIDSFYPGKDRFALAMKLNSLLASPGFEAWMEGVPLNAGSLFYTESGKPRLSVISIAHLSDPERMFFVTMLLAEILSWMRTQPGTGSLRAILYMDEIFGYMPPTANPPSKMLMLTLLKQARAYGLGLVLATQNPVDLDYKGLSNTGTWFIGRLQTERDKLRVMEGLEGAAAGGEFDKQKTEQILAGLGKRKFLLHNVHESQDVVFETRWVMSYLAGPMTRTQIKSLVNEYRAAPVASSTPEILAAPKKVKAKQTTPPILPDGIPQHYLPLAESDTDPAELVYKALLIGAAEVGYSSARYKIHSEKRVAVLTEIDDGPVPVEWDEAEEFLMDLDELERKGLDAVAYAEVPSSAAKAKNYGKWEKSLKRWLRSSQLLTVYKSPTFKVTSTPEESEGEFRARLQTLASEQRDELAEKLRKKYASKVTTLENRLMRAEQAIERESEQSNQKKMDTAIAFGSALLGAFLGRKKVNSRSTSKMGTALRTAGRMRKEGMDVERAEETAESVRVQLSELQQEFEHEIEKLDEGYDSQFEGLDEIIVKPGASATQVHFVGIVWAPYYQSARGKLQPAWE